MRYSYESKAKAVELYRKDLWPETPQGMNEYGFRNGKQLGTNGRCQRSRSVKIEAG